MAESALFKSYRDTEKKRLRQQADEALAQVAAEEAAHTGEKFGPPSPQPGQTRSRRSLVASSRASPTRCSPAIRDPRRALQA